MPFSVGNHSVKRLNSRSTHSLSVDDRQRAHMPRTLYTILSCKKLSTVFQYSAGST